MANDGWKRNVRGIVASELVPQHQLLIRVDTDHGVADDPGAMIGHGIAKGTTEFVASTVSDS